jgi:hypothetical protein
LGRGDSVVWPPALNGGEGFGLRVNEIEELSLEVDDGPFAGQSSGSYIWNAHGKSDGDRGQVAHLAVVRSECAWPEKSWS